MSRPNGLPNGWQFSEWFSVYVYSNILHTIYSSKEPRPDILLFCPELVLRENNNEFWPLFAKRIQYWHPVSIIVLYLI